MSPKGPKARSISSLGQRPRSDHENNQRAESPIYRMPQSLAHVVLHVIFSTKDREPFFPPALRPELHAYLAVVARNNESECYRVGGVTDHVHLALSLPRTLTVADLVEELKTSSSKWIKTKSPRLASFAWQRGYGAFSVGPGDRGVLCAYIDNQEEHHRTWTFQDEYRTFLARHGVAFDERYVWD
jgi:putative transposase